MSSSKRSILLAAAALAFTFAAAEAHAQTTLEWIVLSVKGERVTKKLDQKGAAALAKSMRAAAKKLSGLVAAKAPAGLSAAEKADYAKSQRSWRSGAATLTATAKALGMWANTQVGSVLGAAGNFGDTPGLNGGDMVSKMAQMNMQFLALQEATQMESRRFQTLSNASKARHDTMSVMKTRHDTAKNSIGNIR